MTLFDWLWKYGSVRFIRLDSIEIKYSFTRFVDVTVKGMPDTVETVCNTVVTVNVLIKENSPQWLEFTDAYGTSNFSGDNYD